MVGLLLGGWLHIFWQLGFIALGVSALIVVKTTKSPYRRRTHMTLGIFYTAGLLIGFVWGLLSMTLLFERMPFQTAHGIIALIIIALIVLGASLGIAIHYLGKRLFKHHFIIQFIGLLLAIIQIVFGTSLFIIIG